MYNRYTKAVLFAHCLTPMQHRLFNKIFTALDLGSHRCVCVPQPHDNSQYLISGRGFNGDSWDYIQYL